MALNKRHQDRIAHNNAVMAGKPVISGTRIPVERVIAQLARDPELDALFVAYPELTVEDVKAALEYAHTCMVKRSQGSLAKEQT